MGNLTFDARYRNSREFTTFCRPRARRVRPPGGRARWVRGGSEFGVDLARIAALTSLLDRAGAEAPRDLDTATRRESLAPQARPPQVIPGTCNHLPTVAIACQRLPTLAITSLKKSRNYRKHFCNRFF